MRSYRFDREDVDALYDLWRDTDEGKILSEILDKLDYRCSQWMTGGAEGEHCWFLMRKKLFVQIMQWHLKMAIGDSDDESSTYTPLE